MHNENISPEMVSRVEVLLGRPPRGLEGVAVTSAGGEPVVIRVASLVEGKPFPTMFWLVDKALSYQIDRVEATGLILQMQQQVDADSALREQMAADHRAHIALRNQYLTENMAAELRELNYYDVLQQRGIGGIADDSRIRCLHTWYAAHLVVPNTIGTLLDEHWLRLEQQA
ncbi:MAG: DUF501 domain-containing protein [Halioglobus sp.]